MTYRQTKEQIAALLGRRPRIVEVPVLTPTPSALWLERVTPVHDPIACPLGEGHFELKPFDEAARRALDSCGRMANLRAELEDWRDVTRRR